MTAQLNAVKHNEACVIVQRVTLYYKCDIDWFNLERIPKYSEAYRITMYQQLKSGFIDCKANIWYMF